MKAITDQDIRDIFCRPKKPGLDKILDLDTISLEKKRKSNAPAGASTLSLAALEKAWEIAKSIRLFESREFWRKWCSIYCEFFDFFKVQKIKTKK